MRDELTYEEEAFGAQARQDMNIYDFLMLGLGEVAYVKREAASDGERYLVCESDGTEIGLADEYVSAASLAQEKHLRLLYVN